LVVGAPVLLEGRTGNQKCRNFVCRVAGVFFK
jgi:hypothetical protein